MGTLPSLSEATGTGARRADFTGPHLEQDSDSDHSDGPPAAVTEP